MERYFAVAADNDPPELVGQIVCVDDHHYRSEKSVAHAAALKSVASESNVVPRQLRVYEVEGYITATL